MKLGNEIYGLPGAGQRIIAEMDRTSLKSRQKEETFLQNDVIHKDNIESEAAKLNELMEPLRTNLKFELHDKLDEYYVTVINQSTNETIREIPPKQFLDMHAGMLEFMGILIDEKI